MTDVRSNDDAATIEASTVAANAARLHQGTVRWVTLHDKVHGVRPRAETWGRSEADLRAKVGPMDAYRVIGVGAFVAAGTILAAFAVFGLTLNTTPSYPRGLWRQVGVAEKPVIRGRMALACPPTAPAFEEAVHRGYMGGQGSCRTATGR
jgi:hypothetical protein